MKKKKKVVIIGDIILDRCISGNASRLSPEAPVPVIQLEGYTCTLGGAANVAANVKSLGGDPLLIGLVGDDSAGRRVIEMLIEAGIDVSGVTTCTHRSTTVKTRVVANGQHVVRIDSESKCSCAVMLSSTLSALSAVCHPGWSGCVVLSDYAKGCISEETEVALFDAIGRFGSPVLIDPKPENLWVYQNLKKAGVPIMMTPNEKEAMQMFRAPSLEDAGKVMNMVFGNGLITAGSRGIYVCINSDTPLQFPAETQNVFDVSGAGDTVVAALSLFNWRLDQKYTELLHAVRIANVAAGVAVQSRGTVAVSHREVRNRLTKYPELYRMFV